MTWKLTVYQRPYLQNHVRRWHHYQHAQEAKKWKTAFWSQAKAKKIPTFQQIEIWAQPTYLRNPYDTDAIAPCVKASIDGLVQAGVIPDDSRKQIIALHFLAPKKGKQDSLTLTIKPVEQGV